MKNILLDFISQHITLTKEEEETILSFDIFRSLKKGTVLLSEGQYSKEGYFVLKGCLRSYYIIEGEEKTTEFYTEMEGITPNCVLSKKPSDYFISCVEDSIISVSNPDMEEEVFQKFPKFESLCRKLTEKKLSENQSSHDEFKTSSPEQRYLKLIATRPDLIQRAPQHQIASYLGIKPQSLSRMRARISKHKK